MLANRSLGILQKGHAERAPHGTRRYEENGATLSVSNGYHNNHVRIKVPFLA